MKYKEEFSLEQRKLEIEKLKEKFPGRIPIIVETNHFILKKKKFLVPNDISVGQFMFILRRRLNINHEEAIYLYCNKILPPSGSSIESLFIDHADDDGFLYFELEKDSTFGCYSF